MHHPHDHPVQVSSGEQAVMDLVKINKFPQQKWPEMARNLTNRAIAQTNDLESLVGLVATGYTHLSQGYRDHSKEKRRVGEEIIGRIETYLEEHLVARYLFGSGSYSPEKAHNLQ